MLCKKGYVFHSQTDSEVLLAAYDYWGEACQHRLNGMWAFAVYDRRKRVLFCSRDRFGIKPFYYFQNANRFAFGSEIKQLLPIMDHKPRASQLWKSFWQRDTWTIQSKRSLMRCSSCAGGIAYAMICINTAFLFPAGLILWKLPRKQ